MMYFKTAMKRPRTGPGKIRPAYRYILAIVGLMIVFGGVLKILNGNLHYMNYRGVLSFAPFSIIIGGLLILMAFRLRK